MEKVIQLAWLIPLLPLLGFLIIGLAGRRLSKGLIGIIGSGSVGLAFLLSIAVFMQVHEHKHYVKVFEWIGAGNLHVDFEFLLDPLSSLFLLIITGVGFLIHVYSTGYMHDDDGFHRFFAYLNLFVFFMLLLVMGSSYTLMFVGWEGVGLCSYLLIGFWFKNTAYNNAAKKAFIVNRIGDLGFLLGMILIFWDSASLSYAQVLDDTSKAASLPHVEWICLLLFIGACGKSAQIPLYTWLPDAMAGPTPVSALIHAATMVTAGVYMIARSNAMYSAAHMASEVVAIVGVLTALFAATIGIFQNDIKKVLAYSTVSQLGLMFLGLGVGAYTGAVFHVMTHAFFKALLFLGAGSVIHAMSGEQDIRYMGGLRKKLPITYATFLIGMIAISGIPPFAGFFSKDEILAAAAHKNSVYWALGVIASMMTAFYMARLLFLTFFGEFRGTEEQKHHLHESPRSMTMPLIILAGLSVVGGFVGIPQVFAKHMHRLEEFLAPSLHPDTTSLLPAEKNHEMVLMAIAVAGALVCIYIAYQAYVKRNVVPVDDEKEMGKFQRIVYNKYYVDEIYDAVIRRPLDWISGAVYRYIEVPIIDGAVNGAGSATKWVGSMARYLQSGKVGFYLLAMVVSIVVVFLVKFIIK